MLRDGTGATTVTIGSAAAIAVQNSGAACAGGEIVADQWYQITVDAALTSCQLMRLAVSTAVDSIGGKIFLFNQFLDASLHLSLFFS